MKKAILIIILLFIVHEASRGQPTLLKPPKEGVYYDQIYPKGSEASVFVKGNNMLVPEWRFKIITEEIINDNLKNPLCYFVWSEEKKKWVKMTITARTEVWFFIMKPKT
jgi:hypothetical protein